MMNNLLFCSVGRRGRLLRNVKETIGKTGLLVGTDLADCLLNIAQQTSATSHAAEQQVVHHIY